MQGIDWLAYQAGIWNQVAEACNFYEVPLLIAGDIFDHWKPAPELINWAIYRLAEVTSDVYAVPGQHDLPHHNLSDIEKTGYWTLVQANVIHNVTQEWMPLSKDVLIYGMPWGEKVPKRDKGYKNHIHVLIAHAYIWQRGSSYPNAPAVSNVDAWAKKIFNFDAAAFGDNHKGFIRKDGKVQIVNCGTLMRRKADEVTYYPRIYLLTKRGEWEPIGLDVVNDQFANLSDELAQLEVHLEMDSFLDSLRELEGTAFDYHSAVKKFLASNENISPRARKIILKTINK